MLTGSAGLSGLAAGLALALALALALVLGVSEAFSLLLLLQADNTILPISRHMIVTNNDFFKLTPPFN